MKTYRFGLANSDRVIEIVAASFAEAKALFKAQLRAEGLLV
jgi:hypothetical protein